MSPAAGTSFNNITVELLRPQGAASNRCEKIVDGPLSDCKSSPDSPLKAVLKLVNAKPAFMTDDILVATVSLTRGVNYLVSSPQSPQLIITCDHSEFKTDIPGETTNVFHGGEILWVSARSSAKITGAISEGTAAVVIISFKDPR